MADGTKIEWADATWNPITGCSVVSPGCTHCYAMKLAGTRLAHTPSRAGLTKPSKAGPVWTGEVRFNEQWLDQPLRWRRSRRIFVCAHGDLFHESVPNEWIDKVFAVMALAPQHAFQVLTKRAERMRRYMTENTAPFDVRHACGRVADQIERVVDARGWRTGVGPLPHGEPGERWWPLPNVWLGVSAEDQERADQRIPELLATPAAVRFVSAEPLLGPISLKRIKVGAGWQDTLSGWRNCEEYPGREERLDWIIVGGESGPGARPMHPQWARDLRDQCVGAGVPYFFKQHGEWIGVPDLRRLPGGSGPGFGRYDHCAYNMDAEAARVGKRAAGRLLDGRTWDQMPEDR